MQERSIVNGAVIDLAAYRDKRHPPKKIPPWTPQLTEQMIDEVSFHLLKAVRALQAIPAP